MILYINSEDILTVFWHDVFGVEKSDIDRQCTVSLICAWFKPTIMNRTWSDSIALTHWPIMDLWHAQHVANAIKCSPNTYIYLLIFMSFDCTLVLEQCRPILFKLYIQFLCPKICPQLICPWWLIHRCELRPKYSKFPKDEQFSFSKIHLQIAVSS